MSTHDPEELYETLRVEGVFEEDGEKLRLSDDFTQTRERTREDVADFDDRTFAARAEEYAGGGEFSPDDLDERTLADAMAIYETCETIDREASVHVARSLARSETDESDPHIPRGFVTLSGEEIQSFMQAHAAAVIYCWREDCEPCDGVKENLEELRREGAIPEEVGLGAVYGPDNATVLYEEYDVGVSPTTLFCSGSTIESRYVGNPGVDGLRSEIETLVADLSSGSE